MTVDAEARKTIRQHRRRKFGISLNVLVSVVLAVLLVCMVNYLSMRYSLRSDWSRTRPYALSEMTHQLLRSLTNDVQVTLFFQKGEAVYHDVDNLAREYAAASPRIRMEFVDPDRHLIRTEELAMRLNVTEPNVVVFQSGGRSAYVTLTDIIDYDTSPIRFGQPPIRRAFRGEQAFSSAILSITQAKQPVVYVLQGHGERRMDRFDPITGYSSIGKRMERDAVKLVPLTLGERQRVPEDCDALIIAGPNRRISQPELDLISAYLETSGRVLFLLDSFTRTGLESVLRGWGVNVDDDVVLDPARTLSGRELFVTEYGSHPITERLRGVTTIFHLPRSVEPAPRTGAGAGEPADRPHVTVLAASTETGWAERDLEQSPMKYDPGIDRPGPVSVAVAVERGPVTGIDVQIRPTRLVVFGDSSFVSNGSLTGGAEDLFMAALNWLLEREQLMAIAPKSVEQVRLVISNTQMKRLFWGVVGGLPAAVGVLGMLVWVARRR